ncbi:MAG: PQQ-dependent sugar dehydrogenase [Candidatus Yanofskybacteria bacterium]|nr:PQQ-dependent sugar dehydrogenase [Candidatus Yanofskybacteria bacterium]
MKKAFVLSSAGFLLVVLVGYGIRERILPFFFAPTQTTTERGITASVSEEDGITIVAEDLRIPWEIAFLPTGELIVTERPGFLVKIEEDSVRRFVVPDVRRAGEGGLMGLALHPRFKENSLLYVYLTGFTEQGGIENRVERYEFRGEELENRTIILQGIPASTIHNGGRIAFGPDGYLYITTGDAGNAERAQDRNSLAGKILRVDTDGNIPEDNPFGSAVYSYGHRNPQGLAWDAQEQLWSTEHGRSGFLSGLDELNLIERGGNYGWPVIEGDETTPGMRSPLVHSGPDETWAPAGMAYTEGSLFFAGLRGVSLYEVRINQDIVVRAHLSSDFGRLRAIALGPDGYLYVSTSNTDGRGNLKTGDDKILRLHPSVLSF